jgi:hypothetical protein
LIWVKSFKIELRGWRCRPLIRHQIDWVAGKLPQAIGVAIGKSTATAIHFQPSAAAISALALSFSVTSRSSNGTSLQPAAVVLEEIAHHAAAGLLSAVHGPR